MVISTAKNQTWLLVVNEKKEVTFYAQILGQELTGNAKLDQANGSHNHQCSVFDGHSQGSLWVW